MYSQWLDLKVHALRSSGRVCHSDEDFEVLFSATSCDLMKKLALQSSSNEILHFAVNIDRCRVSKLPIRLDRVPRSDVTQAIADVVQERQRNADIVVLHDVNYENHATVKSLLSELTRRRIRYSYLLFERNVWKISRRMDMVRRGQDALTVIALADYSELKLLLDKMYEQHLLDSNIYFLIVNDGWEAVNPEIDEPQRVQYALDLQMLLLKRQVSQSFSSILLGVVQNDSDTDDDKRWKWKVPYLSREEVYVSAAVWSVVESSNIIWSHKKQSEAGKCSSFNESNLMEENSFRNLVLKFMMDIGVLADTLQYDLLRNIPVDSKREIFRTIAQWRASANPRFKYLGETIEARLLFENRIFKLAIPYAPPYTFPSERQRDDSEQGAVVKLFEFLMKKLKFRYQVLSPDDNEWGVLMDNGEWSGAVGMLLDRSADLIPFLGITKGRNKVLDFSDPVMTTSSAILVQKPREPPRNLIFLRPFRNHVSYFVWFLIIIMVPLMAVVLYYVNKKSSRYANIRSKKMKGGLFKFENCFWYMYGAILQQGVCHSDEDFEVLFSATSCDLMKKLALQSSSNGILHFAVNIDRCRVSKLPIRLDRVPRSDVTQAIADVVQERQRNADIVVLHDVNYENHATVKSLLSELTRRRIRYSYLLFERNVWKISRRMDMVRRGQDALTVIALADYSELKLLLDKMYEQHLLDSNIYFLIVNDGWEAVNPEIDEPQRVQYALDLQMLLLKRQVSQTFSSILLGVVRNDSDTDEDKLWKWKVPYLGREEVYVSAAVWSVVESSNIIWSHKKQSEAGKCSSFNESNLMEENSFRNLVLKFMMDIGVLADTLQYDLLRNIPVDSEREIFRTIAQWRASANPRFKYLSETIEARLLFENRIFKLAIPYAPPYTFPSERQKDDSEQGAVVKLFEFLMKKLKFRYQVLLPDDNEWGVLMDNGEWSGAVGMLLDRSADLIPFLGITKGRNKVLDFSDPVMTTSSAILVQKPREPPRNLIFLRPFRNHVSYFVWFLIIIMVPLMAVVLYYVNKKSSCYANIRSKKMKGGLFKFENCFWYMYGAILQQGGVHLPETVSARFVVCFWWLFVMVTMATYSGNLIAFLTFPEADWIVTSVYDLARTDSILIVVQEGESIYQGIMDSSTETLQLLKQRIEENRNIVVVNDTTSILHKVEKGTAAFLNDFFTLSEIIKTAYSDSGKCRLALAPNTFLESSLAVAARKGSPYIKEINAFIRHLWHGGLMQHWTERYSKLKSHECYFITTSLRGGRKDVTLKDLLGAFLMLLCGLCISSIIIMTELGSTIAKRLRVRFNKPSVKKSEVVYIDRIILSIKKYH
ncbi:uncharacterized protein LOC129223197 [Uloborus diversus]|uniref:uncharacterized protein LOC129223197 n=1 Tax=Uloborus diversus TaxID=327109 RepID=UPI00240A7ED9|nr:uncharacterized protein LOC129223197 [Uloborus diversus]